MRQHTGQQIAQGVAADWLRQVIDCAEAHRLVRVGAGGDCRQDRHRRRVQQDGIGMMTGQPGERGVTIRHAGGLVAEVAQRHADCIT
ncbi:MAG TPA: hypothetical protein VE690_12105 [Rhodopila sp.]|nr:hypothetical protein [Rhodopila sp.]